jgi:predicted nucleotide-binding protein
MKYHIEFLTNSNHTEFKLDLSEEELQTLYIEPYLYGEKVVLNGRTVDTTKIQTIKIFKTLNSIEEILIRVRKNIDTDPDPMSILRSPVQEALEHTETVTDNFIKSSAGSKKRHQKSLNHYAKLTNNQVFIVHGHDNEAKTEVARFIEKLGLEAIILHEQTSGSATVIEKIEKHTNVGFGIVLYTSCDIGNVKSKPEELNNRARQNVVFEHGYLMGKIGRRRVAALVKGDLETPSDISGMVYVGMDPTKGWQLTLAKEMKALGLDVDLNKL